MVIFVQPIIAYVDGEQVVNIPVTKSLQDVCSSSSGEICSCATGELATWTTKWFSSSKNTRRKPEDVDSSSSEVNQKRLENNLKEAKDRFEIREPQLAQLRSFSMKELQVATNNFSLRNRAGRGGFGIVYKGKLLDGSLVAIKRCSRSGGDLQFQREIQVRGMAVHRNLLPLYGYCIDSTERLLVYPFVTKGDLYSYMKRKSRMPLDWTARRKIALGVAKGLAYLHEECLNRIIHRDVKPANILLDDNFEPFITDFGLARPMKNVPFPVCSEENTRSRPTGWPVSNIVDDGITHVSTDVIGTYGYTAPEYVATGRCSEKNDVYAFGVTILQLASGCARAFPKHNLDSIMGYGRKHNLDSIMGYGGWSETGVMQNNKYDHIMGLDGWAEKLVKQNNIEQLVDSELQGKYIEEEMDQMIKVGLMCTRIDDKERPKMSDVIRMLEEVSMAPGWEECCNGIYSLYARLYDEFKYPTCLPSNCWPWELSGPR